MGDLLPNEKKLYGLLTLPSHLAKAGKYEKLKKAISTFDFLQQQLEKYYPQLLIENFNFIDDPNLKIIQDTIQLSTHVLFKDRYVLAQQLLGRIDKDIYDSSEVIALLAEASDWDGANWLCPILPSLAKPSTGLKRKLIGQKNEVHSITITPDGEQIISGGSGGTIIVWDVKTGNELRRLYGHKGTVSRLAILPDGKRLVSCGGSDRDRSIRIWDIQSGEILNVLSLHQGGVSCVATFSDDRRIVTGSLDGNIVIWDINAGTYINWYGGNGARIWSVDVSDDNKWIVVGFGDGTLSILNVEIGEWEKSARLHQTYIHDVAFVDQTNRVMTASEDGSLILWDFMTDQVIRRFDGKSLGINSFALLPTKNQMISACDDSSLTLWNIANGEQIRKYEGHFDNVKTVAVSKYGTWAASGGGDYHILTWDLEKIITTKSKDAHKKGIIEIEFLDNDQILRTSSFDGDVFIWDVASGEILQKDWKDPKRFVKTTTLEMPHGVLNPPFESFEIPAQFKVEQYKVSPDGNFLTGAVIEVATTSNQPVAAMWHMETREKIHQFVLPSGYHTQVLGISSDGQKSVAIIKGKIALLFNFRTGHILELPTPLKSKVDSVHFVENENVAIFWTTKGQLAIWNWTFNSIAYSASLHQNKIQKMVCSLNHGLIVTASFDGELFVWEYPTLRSLNQLKGHDELIMDMMFSKNDGFLATASADNSVRVWQPGYGKHIASFVGESWMRTVVISSDSTTICAGEENGSLHILKLILKPNNR